jgi:hypothetical protein
MRVTRRASPARAPMDFRKRANERRGLKRFPLEIRMSDS